MAGFQFLPKSFVYYAGDPVTYCNTVEDLRTFLDRAEHPYVIVHGYQVDEIEGALPGRLTEFARQQRFLRREDVVILAAAPPSGSTSPITLGQTPLPTSR